MTKPKLDIAKAQKELSKIIYKNIEKAIQEGFRNIGKSKKSFIPK